MNLKTFAKINTMQKSFSKSKTLQIYQYLSPTISSIHFPSVRTTPSLFSRSFSSCTTLQRKRSEYRKRNRKEKKNIVSGEGEEEECKVTEMDATQETMHPLYTPNIVKIGKVSPPLPIPETIEKPPYYDHPKKDHYEFSTPIKLHKTEEEIEGMRQSCKLARKVLHFAKSLVRPGITTDEIDRTVHEYILKHNAYPSPYRYNGFPKSICTSINEVIVHGIPDSRPLEVGDIMNIDVTVYYKGFHGDTSTMVQVIDEGESNNMDDEAKRKQDALKHLMATCKKCLFNVIHHACGPTHTFYDIGEVISQTIEKECNSMIAKSSNYGNYVSPKDFCGHGISNYFHGFPQIFHYRNRHPSYVIGGVKMLPGMIFTVEPVLKAGADRYVVLPDEWTIVAADRKCSAQYEHTILITRNGVEILTFDDKEDDFNPIISNTHYY